MEIQAGYLTPFIANEIANLTLPALTVKYWRTVQFTEWRVSLETIIQNQTIILEAVFKGNFSYSLIPILFLGGYIF